MTEPFMAQKSLYPVVVEAGQRYGWCACGRSKTQPFRDGSHQGSDFKPVEYQARESGTVYLRGCKRTGNRPRCAMARTRRVDPARRGHAAPLSSGPPTPSSRKPARRGAGRSAAGRARTTRAGGRHRPDRPGDAGGQRRRARLLRTVGVSDADGAARRRLGSGIRPARGTPTGINSGASPVLSISTRAESSPPSGEEKI